MKPSGNPDSEFTIMIPHHQTAAEMAKAYLKYGQAPELRNLAQKIIAD
jgi:uncharacterized protein (DUF305 family)